MSTNTAAEPTAQQLPLLELTPVARPRRVVPLRRIPARLRLDEQTRRIGLAGVAEARAILAAQAERRHGDETGRKNVLTHRTAA